MLPLAQLLSNEHYKNVYCVVAGPTITYSK